MPDVRPAVDFENRPAGESGLMLSERASTIRFLALIGVLTVGCDQASKWLARNSLGEDSRVVLGGVMELSLSHNPGGFLSLGAGLAPTTRAVVFTGATAAFVLASFVVLSVPTLHLRRRTQVGLAHAPVRSEISSTGSGSMAWSPTSAFYAPAPFIQASSISLTWPSCSGHWPWSRRSTGQRRPPA